VTDNTTIGAKELSPEGSHSNVELAITGWSDSNTGDESISSDGAAISPGNEVGSAEVLAGLVEKTLTDAAAPFAPECLTELAVLKKNDRQAFEKLRSQLKHAGCRVSSLDEAIAEENGDFERATKETDVLVGLAQEAELFRTEEGTSYADLDVDGHRETWPVRSRGFDRWITRRYYEEEQGAPSSIALRSTLKVLEARAQYDAPERAVYVRVARQDDRLYLDLCDDNWRAVEIDAVGWRVIDSPPVRFRRAGGMQPLPMPVSGGSIEALRSLLNVKSNGDFVLVVAWALAALSNRGPYPLLVLSGEQGSAKSTFSAVLRSLIDPNSAPLRSLPREERDLFLAANNGHVLAFDNISGLPSWASDALCRVASGGAYSARQLYSDDDEVLFEVQKPMIVNGIDDFITKADLADRAVFLALQPITEARRRPESELKAALDAERPRILGALLDGVVRGLDRFSHTELEQLPRMADFAKWATACETAFWPSGTFNAAYQTNRDEAADNVIDADPVASAIRTMMVSVPSWKGTAASLLITLLRVSGEREPRSKSWPQTPRAVGSRLRRVQTSLRKIGIVVAFSREGHGRQRIIHIRSIRAIPLEAEAADEAGPSAFTEPSAPDQPVALSDQNVVTPPRVISDVADGLADDRRPKHLDRPCQRLEKWRCGRSARSGRKFSLRHPVGKH
jgi:hypothetical protein